MVSSIAGNYSDVVALIPITTLTWDVLYNHFLTVLKLVEDAGLKCVSVILDGHPTNAKFYLHLCGGIFKTNIPHPLRPKDPLFLLFDTVHLMKNFLNNFRLKR